jgi:hypothetical protein|nr:MAG TPA: Tas1 [Caudoviricetes sp.]
MNIKNIIQLLLQSSSDFNKLHDYVITELSKAVNKSVNEANPEELFKIAKTCTPTEKDRVQALLDAYNNAVLSLIKQGITKAVLFSTNTQQNALSAFTRFEGKEVDAWRKETARAFIESRMKRDNGLNLSDRVWNYTQQTKSEFEVAVSQVLENGIGKGISAESLGRQVRQYLNNPDMMYRRYHRKQLMSDGTKKDIVEWRRRVIDKEGKVRFIKEDLAKVGTGVYRSARQNALRLTITETNMAYNYSNCKRWESEPFVLGIRIRLSANHPEEDICDELAGDYPKTFMWRGWHPRCMCSVSPILMDRKSDEWKKLRKMPKEEYEAYQSPNLVQNVPDKFSKWCERNAKKLDLARKNGKLPYFVRDNIKAVGKFVGWNEDSILAKEITEVCKMARASGKEVQSTAESIAQKYGAKCTPINFKSEESIRRKVLLERQEIPMFSPKNLKDTVRTTIVADNKDIDFIISDLVKHKSFVRLKEQKTSLGYVGNIVNLITNNGLIAEIQVITPYMIYAKEPPKIAKQILGESMWNKIMQKTKLEGGLGHKFYEQWRLLNPKSKEAIEIAKKSVEYYGHFRT